MRRALLSEWPALSVQYGIHPWDVGGPRELTVGETEAYVRSYRESVREQQQQRMWDDARR